jgi:hypothetical protein
VKGDTKNKRTSVQIQEDRDYICKHYMRGVSHVKIAEQMVIDLKRDYILSRQQIEYDIKEIIKGLRESYEAQLSDYLFQQLRKIDELEFEAWTAWEASKKARKKTTIITKKNQVKQEPGEDQPKDPQDVIIESADQTGDIRYFDKIQWCVETRLKLLGFFRMNQYAKTLDQGEDDEQHQTGVVIYIPDNNRQ